MIYEILADIEYALIGNIDVQRVETPGNDMLVVYTHDDGEYVVIVEER